MSNTNNLYLIMAMKRSGHHAFINWLCSLHNNITHHNDPTGNWEQGQFKGRKITSYGKGKDLCINLEDFDMDDFNILNLPPHINLYPIIFVRDFPNWIASSYKRKDHPNPTYQDVYLNLNKPHTNHRGIPKPSRIDLWKKQIEKGINPLNNFIPIPYNTWLTSSKYRNSLSLLFNLPQSSTQTISKLSEFGKGSSFTAQNNKYIDPEDVLSRYSYFTNDITFNQILNQNLDHQSLFNTFTQTSKKWTA